VGFVGSIAAVAASILFTNRLIPYVSAFLFNTKSPDMLNYALARVVTMALIFVILQMLVRMATGALDAVFKLPLLHQANSLLGGAFGLLKGVLAVFVLCALLQLALPFITVKYPAVTQQSINQSRIYQFVYVHNPVYKLFETQI
jgi:uncharacterized membrane protein required for colicin V production